MNMNTEIGGLCPRVEAVFALLARKWAGPIVFSLKDGERRFCDLERALPDISARVLTQRVRELEDAGLVERLAMGCSPARVGYRLTSRGLALAEALEPLVDWAKSLSAAVSRPSSSA